jgi:hypothetical protein
VVHQVDVPVGVDVDRARRLIPVVTGKDWRFALKFDGKLELELHEIPPPQSAT